MNNTDFMHTDGFKNFCFLLNSSFGLHLSIQRLSQIEGVGELYWLIAEHYSDISDDRCLSMPVFYSLRRGLMACEVSRRSIKQHSPLIATLPHKNVVQNWSKLRQSVGHQLTELPRYSPIEIALVSNLIIGMCLSFWSISHFHNMLIAQQLFYLGLFMTGITMHFGIYGVTDKNAIYCYPENMGTIRDSTVWLIAMNFDHFASLHQRWNSSDLLRSLKLLIHYTSEHDASEITLETKFNDLCFDD